MADQVRRYAVPESLLGQITLGVTSVVLVATTTAIYMKWFRRRKQWPKATQSTDHREPKPHKFVSVKLDPFDCSIDAQNGDIPLTGQDNENFLRQREAYRRRRLDADFRE